MIYAWFETYIVVQMLTNLSIKPVYYHTQFIQPSSLLNSELNLRTKQGRTRVGIRVRKSNNRANKICGKGEQGHLSDRKAKQRERQIRFVRGNVFYSTFQPPLPLSPSLPSPPSFLRGGGQRPVCWAPRSHKGFHCSHAAA